MDLSSIFVLPYKTIIMKSNIPVKKSRLRLLHQYYTYTGFYKFLGESLKKSIVPILAIIAGILALNHYFDLNAFLVKVTQTYSSSIIYAVFFVSESILGLLPPEIFIAWSGKTVEPLWSLSILATLSYCGGIVSYFIGKSFTKIPSVHTYMEQKMSKHLKNTKKWGGFLIVVGALLPIPFSMTSIAAGMIQYGFRSYLMFGLLRFLRFYIYALAIFSVV